MLVGCNRCECFFESASAEIKKEPARKPLGSAIMSAGLVPSNPCVYGQVPSSDIGKQELLTMGCKPDPVPTSPWAQGPGYLPQSASHWLFQIHVQLICRSFVRPLKTKRSSPVPGFCLGQALVVLLGLFIFNK